MSENGEIYTAGKNFCTAAGTDGMDKFHLWFYTTRNRKKKSLQKKNKIDYGLLHGSLHSFGVNISSCTKTDLASSIYPEAIYSTAPPATNYT